MKKRFDSNQFYLQLLESNRFDLQPVRIEPVWFWTGSNFNRFVSNRFDFQPVRIEPFFSEKLVSNRFALTGRPTLLMNVLYIQAKCMHENTRSFKEALTLRFQILNYIICTYLNSPYRAASIQLNAIHKKIVSNSSPTFELLSYFVHEHYFWNLTFTVLKNLISLLTFVYKRMLFWYINNLKAKQTHTNVCAYKQVVTVV